MEYYLEMKWYNMDEPWKYHAKWKKPETIGHMLYYSIYIKCPDRGILVRLGLGKRKWEMIANRYRVSS